MNEISEVLPGYSSFFGDGIYANTATKELFSIFQGHYFDFPKPVEIIKQLIDQVTEPDDIILDFFSGSATTAHAAIQLNSEDNGKRRFILVQLPEKTEIDEYPTICEICKERIRRAGAQITTGDTGFRVFKLDTSNLKTWDAAPIEGEALGTLYERMNGMVQRVKPDRSDLDMVFEVMLKLDVPPTYVVSPVSINGKTAYSVGEDCLLLVCLAPDVLPEDVEQMAEYAPPRRLSPGMALPTIRPWRTLTTSCGTGVWI